MFADFVDRLVCRLAAWTVRATSRYLHRTMVVRMHMACARVFYPACERRVVRLIEQIDRVMEKVTE
jgi:hypothetical protein